MKKTHGNASWAGFLKKRQIINPNHTGLVVDGVNHLTEKTSCQHLMLLAPSGMGKTYKYIYPNLMRQNFHGSIVVMDPSGEIFEKTAASLQKQGANIIVIRPFSDEKTNYYNPLKNVNTLSEAKQIADALTDQIKSKGNPFWDRAGSSLLASLIYFMGLVDTKNIACFTTLKSLLSLDDQKRDALICKLKNKQLNEEYSLYENSATEVKASILATAKAAIEIYSDENIAQLTEKSDFEFKEIKEKETIVYVIIPETKIYYCRGFLSLFYKQLFDFLTEYKDEKNSYGHHVQVFLEEFGNIGRIPNMSSYLTTIRKRRVSISIVIQSIHQIHALYGDNAQSIISGCVSKLFYPGIDDVKTLKMISDLLGQKTIQSSTYNSSSEGTSYGTSGQSLMTVDQLRTMDDNHGILISRNYLPIYLRNIKEFHTQKQLQSFIEYNEQNEFNFCDEREIVTAHAWIYT